MTCDASTILLAGNASGGGNHVPLVVLLENPWVTPRLIVPLLVVQHLIPLWIGLGEWVVFDLGPSH
jgi:hypothetical protein